MKQYVRVGLLIPLSFLVVSAFISFAYAEQRTIMPEKDRHYFGGYDVIIDVGHGGIDGGTNHGAVLEKQLNLEIGTKLYHFLHQQGYRVGITRLKDYALSDDSPFREIRSRHAKDLKQRWLIAHGLKPKIFISIHINFSSHRYVRGPIILYQKQGESYLLAHLMQSELNTVAQSQNHAKLGRTYFLLNHVTQPSLIAEVGYISHPSERKNLQDEAYQQEIVEHISSAINQYFLLYQ